MNVHRLITITLLLCFGVTIVMRIHQPQATAQPLTAGLSAQIAADGRVIMTMPGRFALTFTPAGISEWRDLRRDPSGNRNLIAPASTLVTVQTTTGAPLSAPPAVVRASPLRALVRYEYGSMAMTYEVWAGGHIAINVTGGKATITGPHLIPDASAGAALQPVKITPAAQHWLLYLDAWAVDELPKLAAEPALAGVTSNSNVGLAASGPHDHAARWRRALSAVPGEQLEWRRTTRATRWRDTGAGS